MAKSLQEGVKQNKWGVWSGESPKHHTERPWGWHSIPGPDVACSDVCKPKGMQFVQAYEHCRCANRNTASQAIAPSCSVLSTLIGSSSSGFQASLSTSQPYLDDLGLELGTFSKQDRCSTTELCVVRIRTRCHNLPSQTSCMHLTVWKMLKHSFTSPGEIVIACSCLAIVAK